MSMVYSKQPIFGLTLEWFRELSFSRLECGVHELHISSAPSGEHRFTETVALYSDHYRTHTHIYIYIYIYIYMYIYIYICIYIDTSI